MKSKAKIFRELLNNRRPIVLVGAHNPLSALLVEETGFDGVWASSFEISTSFGLPDASILTMSENLYITKMMNNRIKIPLIADCDNGYGNVINVIRLVEEYEAADIAGICIEDNIFPKRHSFLESVSRGLETIEVFSGKIMAAKATQKTKDFVVIARTEAFIAGLGLNEALKRAIAYEKAGADLIVIHSKKDDHSELLRFKQKWTGKVPLVAIPTKFANVSSETLFKEGYQITIFANLGIRASIFATQIALRRLHKTKKLAALDDLMVPLSEIYSLTKVQKMQNEEKKYSH